MRSRALVRLLPAILALVALAATVSVSGAVADGGHHKNKPDRVNSRDEGAKQKLSAGLETKLESGSTAPVAVVVTIQNGDLAQAKSLLTDSHTAAKNGVALVVGKTPASKLGKLAGVKGVVSVAQVEFKQTGRPAGSDPDVGVQPDKRTRNEALRAFQRNSVPFSKAPPLKTSNFDQQKSLDVLDAKTHNFTGAWKAGFTGTGVTVSVLDGGTDWGHPDLVGTWQTWSQADVANGADPGWVGWPKAFDPYDTLVMLAAPSLIDQGLTWYTPTTAVACTYVKKNGRPARPTDRDALCSVSFGTKTGPSRNIQAPAGVNVHTYTFPASWTKSGTVKLASHPDDYLLELYGERPAVLVTDPTAAGKYDTAYVDLSDDFDFSDEKPVTKSSPVSYRDLNGDGYTDLSGGLLYYISDGATTIPGGPTDFGVTDTPGPGDFLAWSGDFDPGIEGHGTLTASNVVGQGVINGKAPSFRDLSRHGGHDGNGNNDDKHGDRGDHGDHGNDRGGVIPGMVLGGAPNAKLAPMGDIYFSFDFSKQFGYLLTNEWGVNVTSNSYGSSDVDNDGMDAGSQEADLIHRGFGAATTPLFSTGNGAPGYGTVTAPSPVLGIQVGASTNFGSTGWDSITNYSQVVDNDVIEWSNRGPGANGRNGVDVVADGSYAPGDATLNTVIDGRNAWTTWGGTSRSTPVAVGETALVYQAWASSHGGAFPTEPTVKAILKSSAKDLAYDGFTQGSGSIDAGRAVAAATGQGGIVTPDDWRPNTDPKANNQPAFPQTIHPGQSATKTFTIAGPGNWSVSDRVLQKYASEPLTFKSASLSQESKANFNAPDYLMDITSNIKAHADADLVVIRANYPHSQFDADTNYQADQAWRLFAYNWTDVNHDHRLWTDRDGNGVVNHTDRSTSSNIDGFPDINFDRSEIEQGEYERFFYHRPGANTLMGFIGSPAKRMADGVFLGLQHSTKNPAIDRTDFTIEIDYYKNVDSSWITTTQPGTSGSFTATISVPANTPYGMYSSAIVASNGSATSVVPVATTVSAVASQNADGSLAAPLEFGGNAVATAQDASLYNNGSFFGANDWTWREESGDWRFFYYDVAKPMPDGTLFLTDTTWDDAAPTDLDTLIFGPSENSFELFNPQPVFAPYILNTVGGSANAYVGSGTWKFDTATNGPEDIVAAPASDGMHAVVEHGVAFNGDKFNVPFKTTIGTASVSPAKVTNSNGHFTVTFKSSVALAGLSADAFGLSQPRTVPKQVKQDNPDDPSTASAKENVAIHHASRATFTLPVGNDDVDMFVLYDANNDGAFTSDEIVGSSTGPAGTDEAVTLVGPPDGNYQIWLHGFQVAGTPTDNLGIDIVQGNDLHITGIPAGPVPANTPVTLDVTYAVPATAGQYKGELLLGPSTAPTAVSVPVTVTVP